MDFTYLLGGVSALWLGILTSISPCPLTTNIAAISYIGRRVGRPAAVLAGGLSYAAGRMIAYLALSLVVVTGLLAMPAVSRFLLEYMNKLLGPLLILTGMFLLELLTVSLPGAAAGVEKSERLAGGGVRGACLLGIIFALSLCPTSAALFFGSLIPLSLKFQSRLIYPSLYGLGTALPVILFAAVVSFSARSVGRFYHRLAQVDRWTRGITGVLFILAGIYYTLTYIYGLQLR